MKEVKIIDRGRGPELAGTRITIFDVLPLFREGWHHSSIALWYNISSRQVLALKEYFDEHREEVLAMNRKIEERIAKGNPPEIEAKLVESRKKLQALREELRKKRQSRNEHDDGHFGG